MGSRLSMATVLANRYEDAVKSCRDAAFSNDPKAYLLASKRAREVIADTLKYLEDLEALEHRIG